MWPGLTTVFLSPAGKAGCLYLAKEKISFQKTANVQRTFERACVRSVLAFAQPGSNMHCIFALRQKYQKKYTVIFQCDILMKFGITLDPKLNVYASPREFS